MEALKVKEMMKREVPQVKTIKSEPACMRYGGKIRSEKHISAIERGERALSIEYATLIAKVLRVRSE